MSLRKIKEFDKCQYKIKLCRHPEHNPPNMIVLTPGLYEHTCPGCGKSFIFTVHERWACKNSFNKVIKLFSNENNQTHLKYQFR